MDMNNKRGMGATATIPAAYNPTSNTNLSQVDNKTMPGAKGNNGLNTR